MDTIAGVKIIDIISNISGSKVVVLDRSMNRLFNIVINYETDLFKKYCVVQREFLDSEKLEPIGDTIIYFAHCNYSTGKLIRTHIKNYPNCFHKIYFTPTRSLMIERLIEYDGINNYSFHDLPDINMQLVDINVWSMEYDPVNKYVIQDDITIPYNIACNIKNYGIPLNSKMQPRIIGIGSCSSRISNIFVNNFQNSYEKFDRIILVDRQCDLVTPLLTPISYRSVLFELHPTASNFTEYDPHIDSIYTELYNKNFSEIGQILHEKTKSRSDAETKYKKEKNNIGVNGLTEMCTGIKNIPKKYLAIHIKNVEECILAYELYYEKHIDMETNITNNIDLGLVHDYIDHMIMIHGSIIVIFRLLSLMILTGKNVDLEHYQREIIHQYGYVYLSIIDDLKKYGFFEQPNDLFLSHTPLTTIINKLITKGKINIGNQKSFSHNITNITNRDLPKNTLIFVVGGLTYDEVDKLHSMKRKYSGNYEIATTSIISANTLIKSFM